MSLQNQWRHCTSCFGLFYTGETDSGTGAADLGACPATGAAHTPNAGARFLAIHNESRPGAQDGWRRCGKCQGLFYGLSPVAGVCPEDGAPHTPSDSETYAAGTGSYSRGAQPGWRWCRHCQGLWHAAGSGPGQCPATAAGHDAAASGEYSVAFEQDFVAPLQVTALASAVPFTPFKPIPIVATVADGAGQPVRGLAAGQFQVSNLTGAVGLSQVTELFGIDGVYLLQTTFNTPDRGSQTFVVRVLRDWQSTATCLAALVNIP